MVRLASADAPGVVCLQELPVWALGHLERWSGMTATGDVARRPTLGPLRSTPEVGRVLTELHHGLLRSAFTGQANAVLLCRAYAVVEHILVRGLRAEEPRAWPEQRRAHGERLLSDHSPVEVEVE